MAFESAASDLVADDNNGLPDVFDRTLAAGTTALVWHATPLPASFTATGQSYLGGISSDGTTVALNSDAGDLGGTTDEETGPEAATVIDTQTGAVFTPVSSSSGHPAPARLSSAPTARSLPSRAAGSSNQSNVYTAADPGGAPVLASVNAAGTGPGNASRSARSSAATAARSSSPSEATDLVPNFVARPGPVSTRDLFARNLTTGVTSLVSINAAGTAAGNGSSGDFGRGATSGDFCNGRPPYLQRQRRRPLCRLRQRRPPT